jgi:predicted secreted Zn-dependent protease
MLTSLFAIVFAIFSHVQSDEGLIDWSSQRRLTWDDFTGTPNANATNAALTSSSIKVEFGYNQTRLRYTIRCRFSKALSWGRVKNDYILGHEQGHFDIAEIHARKLNKALKEYKFNSKTVSDDVNRIYEKIMSDHQELQQQYDQETDHSRKFPEQGEWEEKIQELLKSYEAYAVYK